MFPESFVTHYQLQFQADDIRTGAQKSCILFQASFHHEKHYTLHGDGYWLPFVITFYQTLLAILAHCSILKGFVAFYNSWLLYFYRLNWDLLKSIFYKKGAKKTVVARNLLKFKKWFLSSFHIKNGL